MKKTVLQRFEEKYIPEPNTGCWLWLSGTDGHGYGQFFFLRPAYKGKMMNAYKFSYEFFVKPVPKGLELDHLCRNRLCVNPDHLEAVTKKVNIQRGKGISALNSKKTLCPKGHKYDEENTKFGKNSFGGTYRYCRKCNNEKSIRNNLLRKNGKTKNAFCAS